MKNSLYIDFDSDRDDKVKITKQSAEFCIEYLKENFINGN
jgi:DNA-dependent RNA polymerase auxiliary subunit epsilon